MTSIVQNALIFYKTYFYNEKKSILRKRINTKDLCSNNNSTGIITYNNLVNAVNKLYR